MHDVSKHHQDKWTTKGCIIIFVAHLILDSVRREAFRITQPAGNAVSKRVDMEYTCGLRPLSMIKGRTEIPVGVQNEHVQVEQGMQPIDADFSLATLAPVESDG